MTNKVYRFQPDASDEGVRLDQFVPAYAKEISRTLFRKIVDIGGVHVGGRRTRKCSQPVKSGELIEVFLDGFSLDPFAVGVDLVLYRDRDFIAIDKPAGVDCQPTPARFKGTVFQALQVYLQDPFRPTLLPSIGMVQRLDRDTSGIMVFSIHPRSHKGLTETFTSRVVKKTYLALVKGSLDNKQAEIRSLLARARATNKVKSVVAGGKEAITRYRVLEEFHEASLLEIEILTGRSHQIRVHCSEASHPLLGDSLYGGPMQLGEMEIHRQMLHACRLEFRHPLTGTEVAIESPIPSDMLLLLRSLRGE